MRPLNHYRRGLVLGVPWAWSAVLYAQLLAQLVELMVATRSLPAGKQWSVNSLPLSVNSLLILIGQAL